ncbi:OmpA family protein [Vibrio sp. SCSIO 43137]|uniref:OmpA family protein n=1 Tax=Vibrio sp. SCSIO 43137 TaxID=3021011 RepID=UPI002307F4A0|nr:OmpA family protein [Vibrio sp. SCSIO 43137]WCE28777.1 OmpA family protein [Vibrio sp. SCSIO 43137]
MKVSLKLLVVTLSWPVSAVCAVTDGDPQAFMTLKTGYQWANDDAFPHTDPSGGVWGISGGLQFSPEWSWDVGYSYHSNRASREGWGAVDVNTWFFDTAARYDWYFKDDWSLYGRLGASYWTLEKSQPNRAKLKARGISPVAEAGVGYRFDENIHLSAGYQYVDSIGRSETGKYDNYALMFNLTYRFGQPSSIITKTEEVPETIELTAEVPAEKTEAIIDVRPVEPAEPLVNKELVVPKIYTFSSLTLGEEYCFDTDSTHVSDAFKQGLKPIASTLVSYPQARVLIVGHADATGTEVYNQKLSERRASAVAAELLELGGRIGQMNLSGKGELDPVASNATAEGRAKNRRVEVTLSSFKYQQ